MLHYVTALPLKNKEKGPSVSRGGDGIAYIGAAFNVLIFDFFWTTLSLLMHYYQMNVMQSVLVDVFMVSVTGVWFYIPN